MRRTSISIAGDEFHINGRPTYAGRMWNGRRIQGLLVNSRMVQGIFDDRNTNTVSRWAYPDTKHWDHERNVREFLAAMPEWRRHGLLGFTINLQGGAPIGYANEQPWHNSGIESDGSLREDYLNRLDRILDRADQLGMVAIVGYFYFGQDERLKDEAAVIRATDGITRWLIEKDYRNVLVEINNECNVRYDHPILQPDRVHELIQRVQQTARSGRRLLVGTSYGGGTIPKENVVRVSDFLLIHGNGVSDPDNIAEMVRKTRQVAGYQPKPILFNEDDHFDFEKPKNNFVAALGEYASWGYFDPGTNSYRDGYQSLPVNWGISTERKRGFFDLVAQITGNEAATPNAAPKYSRTTIQRQTYHGWKDSILLDNGIVEAAIVPSVGRVMQFKFAGDADGPFWENRDLDGTAPNATSRDWVNFGGDKTWPSPQADWPKVTPRGWPPPVAFDSMPVEAIVDLDAVILTSPVDPNYGIKTQRKISLERDQPVMRIVTTYEKIRGDNSRAGVWIITQLKHPQLVGVPVPARSQMPQGYVKQSDALPLDFKNERGLISLKRNTRGSFKIGTDSSTLVWVGESAALKIDSPRSDGLDYPDQGSSAEVYTNPDPAPYVELEMLGPLHSMKVGDRISQTNTYTLSRRTAPDSESEVRKLVGR